MQYKSKYNRRKCNRNKLHFLIIVPEFAAITVLLVMVMKLVAGIEIIDKSKDNFTIEYDAYEEITTEEETTTKEETTSEEETTEEIFYDYSSVVPENDAVDNSYFDDAVFIGDSRTEGLILSTGLSNTTAYTYKGLTVDSLTSKPVIKKNGVMLSVMDALKETDFNKVYIMLGINETGWPYSEVFIKVYGGIIDEIKQINPNAKIYVQEIIPVAESVSSTHNYIKNEKIREFNNLLCKMAEEKEVYFIDTGKAIAGQDGILPEDAAYDGIHLKKAYCEKWLEYLKTHTVS